MAELIKVEAIKIEDIITVEIGGGFYARLHQLIQSMMSGREPEEVTKALESIKENKPSSEFAYHLLTVITLIKGIEESAKTQGKITQTEVDPDKVPSS